VEETVHAEDAAALIFRLGFLADHVHGCDVLARRLRKVRPERVVARVTALDAGERAILPRIPRTMLGQIEPRRQLARHGEHVLLAYWHEQAATDQQQRQRSSPGILEPTDEPTHL